MEATLARLVQTIRPNPRHSVVGWTSVLFSVLVAASLLLAGLFVYRLEVDALLNSRMDLHEALPLVALGYSTLVVLAVAVVEISLYRRRVRQANLQADALRDLVRKLLSRVEDEQRRLGSMLHDDIGGGLTALKLEIEQIRRARAPAEADWARGFAALDRLLQRARGIAHLLYPSMIGGVRLSVALAELADRLSSDAMRIAVDAGVDIDSVGPEQGTRILRVIQEAVVNAIRHAKANALHIVVKADGAVVRGHVDDDGVGWGDWSEGLGLALMRESVASAGGEVEFSRSPQGGARVGFVFPVRAADPPGAADGGRKGATHEA